MDTSWLVWNAILSNIFRQESNIVQRESNIVQRESNCNLQGVKILGRAAANLRQTRLGSWHQITQIFFVQIRSSARQTWCRRSPSDLVGHFYFFSPYFLWNSEDIDYDDDDERLEAGVLMKMMIIIIMMMMMVIIMMMKMMKMMMLVMMMMMMMMVHLKASTSVNSIVGCWARWWWYKICIHNYDLYTMQDCMNVVYRL